MGDTRVRVVIVDDSLVAREMLTQILASDPAVEVVGTAKDGREAIDVVARLRPDLVTMDIHMPNMDGLEATERIMAYTPTPILVVSSSVHGEGVGRAFDALGAGALEVVKKPEPRDWAELERIGRDIIRRVRLLARIKVITHIKGRRADRVKTLPEPPATLAAARQLVAIGSSTGGPSALLSVLGRLPAGFPVPVVIAQHIADGFVPGLVDWLDAGCAIHVKEAEHGEQLAPGTAYLAATGANMVVRGMTVAQEEPLPKQLYIPSADTLFESVAVEHRAKAIGVILTGMGADGARGLRRMRDSGAPTIAQDEATSTVYGMPKAAVDIGAVQRVLPVQEIAAVLEELVESE